MEHLWLLYCRALNYNTHKKDASVTPHRLQDGTRQPYIPPCIPEQNERYMHIYIHTYVHTYDHTHIYLYICTYIYIYTDVYNYVDQNPLSGPVGPQPVNSTAATARSRSASCRSTGAASDGGTSTWRQRVVIKDPYMAGVDYVVYRTWYKVSALSGPGQL